MSGRSILSRDTSFKVGDDRKIVSKTQETPFFFLEPGAGVVVLGLLLEPDKKNDIVAWLLSLCAASSVCAVPNPAAKASSLALLGIALRPFGQTPYVRFVFGMAAVMRALRVVEVLLEPGFFEERGLMYTTKFCFLYHDLRRASFIDKDHERETAIRLAIRNILFNVLGVVITTGLIRLEAVKQRWYVIAVASMYRFYFLVSLAEAGYRLHLAYFSIKAPVCFDNPWESKTVAEFWGKRWNLSIAQQLRNVFYRPVMSLTGDKRLGALTTFIASSALHMIPIVSMGGSRRAVVSTALFFLLQPIIMATENALKIQSRLWVHGILWAFAPLFSLPIYEVS